MSFFHSHSFSRCLSTVAFALITAFTANAQIVIPSSGYINTIAGNGTQGTSGNGGPALNAELNWLGGVALDGSGNLFILDTCTVREVSAQTGDISVVVGNGTCGYSGDGGPAIDAEINTYFYNKFLGPVPQGGIATDALGNLYIADARNSRLRKVNMQTGIITTIAGSSIGGYSGDGGPANNAVLNGPSALTLDSQGNIYFVDGGNFRVRKISSSTGIINTIAGNGTNGYTGDGGSATNAEISATAIAVDATGNVIISCSNRVRSVNQSTGIITTVAGTGVAGYSGDGGSATSAELNNNVGVAVDSFGNIYIADRANYRIRFVSKSNGIITTFAGTGTLGHTGDGGRAVDAELYPWAEIAVNQQGSVVFCDSAASRIRAIGGSAVTGVINPKYAIVGVTYAPPGPSSYVQYTNSTYVGSTTTLASSFSSSEALSVSVNAGIKAWGANNGFTVTSTTTATQASNSSSTVTVGIQSTLSDKTTGTPNAFSPVDHDYDIIWLWLNPVLAFTVSPNNPNSLTWNGYAYDTADNDIVDIYPVYVGQLNGHFAIDPSTQAELSRSWATGQTWPSGQGPALNSADYAAILGADPFSNPNYSVTIQQGSNPGTTEDGRFTLSGGVNGVAQSFDYVQSPNNGGALTQQYSNVYTNTSTLSQGSTYTYQEAFGLEQKFGGTLFGISLTNDLKQTQTLTWTNSVNTSITNTTTETDALSITGPSCAGSPCSPAYAGPPEFSVFQDNLYGTFMFNPI